MFWRKRKAVQVDKRARSEIKHKKKRSQFGTTLLDRYDDDIEDAEKGEKSDQERDKSN